MYQYKYLIIICCFFVFLNCTKEQKTIYSEVNITTNDNNLVEVNIPKAEGNKSISNQINSEIQKKNQALPSFETIKKVALVPVHVMAQYDLERLSLSQYDLDETCSEIDLLYRRVNHAPMLQRLLAEISGSQSPEGGVLYD